jgi:hypothetical protein
MEGFKYIMVDYSLMQKGPTVPVGNPFNSGFPNRTANSGIKALFLVPGQEIGTEGGSFSPG